MSLLKCPLFWYNKGSIITCKNRIVTKTDFATREKAEEHKKINCETMNYKHCPIYRRKEEE